LVEVERLRGRSRVFSESSARHRRARSQSKSLKEVGVLFVVAVLCLTGFALLLTARQAELARLGYEIGAQRKILASLESEYQRLSVEAARLQSLERIESAALQLGMVKPSEIRVVYSEEPEPIHYGEIAEGAPSLRQMLTSIANAVSRLASGVMGAEARTLK